MFACFFLWLFVSGLFCVWFVENETVRPATTNRTQIIWDFLCQQTKNPHCVGRMETSRYYFLRHHPGRSEKFIKNFYNLFKGHKKGWTHLQSPSFASKQQYHTSSAWTPLPAINMISSHTLTNFTSSYWKRLCLLFAPRDLVYPFAVGCLTENKSITHSYHHFLEKTSWNMKKIFLQHFAKLLEPCLQPTKTTGG